ncbi:MAG: cob(I)yrinic acid a,c-diamide adenosyltransferase [Thermoplasmata archaeon]|nr:cob(I)yrinic acid a,c-diamide adenosyltransferase [Euryarchaeota archaeon]RLF65807.1 MAG: cob(I)yrinic acid a,c-diamide adenosyltransferase [Thermoplasmata archaeon]
MLSKGYVHVYTGDGKGKTTAAFGLAMRAAGHGLKVAVVQFMKGIEYGEIKSARKLGIEVYQFGTKEFVDPKEPRDIDVKLAKEALEKAKELIFSGNYDLVILDEVNVAMSFGLVDVKDVLNIIENKPENVEIVLTGRYAPEEIIKKSDLVTEMREVKHYFMKGVIARKGIEF